MFFNSYGYNSDLTVFYFTDDRLQILSLLGLSLMASLKFYLKAITNNGKLKNRIGY